MVAVVTPYDDPSIADSNDLIRLIFAGHLVTGKHGNKRVSSKAFNPASEGNGLSVYIKKLLDDDGKAINEVWGEKSLGCVVFTAGDARGLGLYVGKTPRPDNKYHGDAWLVDENGEAKKFGRQLRQALKGKSNWLIPIPGVILH